MLAIVRPERWDDVRGGLRALGPAGRGDRPGDRRRRHRRSSTATAARSPGSRPRALTSDAIVHERVAAPPPRRRAAPGAGRPGRGRADAAARSGAWTRAPSCWPCSARRTSPRGARSSSSTTRPSRRTPSRGPATARRSLRIKGTTKALVASTDANQAVGALDPWLGAALSVAEATRNVAITGARPLGVTNCLNYGDPTRPEAFWQLSEAVRGLGDACRALGLPVTGGNVSLYNESPAGRDRADARDRRRRAARGRRAAASGPAFARGRRRGRSSSARRRRASRAASTRRWPGSRRRTARRRSTSTARGALQAFVREAAARGLLASRPGRLGRRPRRRARRGGDLGRRRSRARRAAPAAGRELAGRRPVRREPVAARRLAPAAPRRRRSSLLARQHGLPVEELGRRSAASGSSSSSPAPARPAPPRSAAAASPTPSTSGSTTSATPGTPGCRGPSAGRAR